MTEKGKKEKIKTLHLVLEDVATLFYFMTFIPKFNIFATRVKKSSILMIFVHISDILKDFLTEMKKINKTKKLRLVDTFFKCGLRF